MSATHCDVCGLLLRETSYDGCCLFCATLLRENAHVGEGEPLAVDHTVFPHGDGDPWAADPNAKDSEKDHDARGSADRE